MNDIREQLNHSFKYHADSLNTHIAKLNDDVKNNLRNIILNLIILRISRNIFKKL